MQRYLITGYAGFVGYHFITHLNSITKEKISVLGIDINTPHDFSDWSCENLEISHKAIDLMNREEVKSVISDFKPTHVVHLASFSSVGKSWQDPAGYFSNNTGIFLNLLEAIRMIDIECRILNIGSSEEYGFIQEEQLPLTEGLIITPANPYAVTKMAQESMAKVYSDGLELNIVSTRSFNHIGPRQRDTFVVANFAKQVAQASIDGEVSLNMKTGNLAVIRDFLDVRDVVNAYCLLLDKGRKGEVYNVCSGNGIPLTRIIEELSIISGIKITTHVDSSLIRPNDISKIIGSNKKLQLDTNWNQKYNLQETLSDTYNYWKKVLAK